MKNRRLWFYFCLLIICIVIPLSVFLLQREIIVEICCDDILVFSVPRNSGVFHKVSCKCVPVDSSLSFERMVFLFGFSFIWILLFGRGIYLLIKKIKNKKIGQSLSVVRFNLARPTINKKKHPKWALFLFLVAGVGFEPHDLQVMSLASYRTALPRDRISVIYII